MYKGHEVIKMEVKEVEKLLGISRSNIRYYEKAGLLHPKRQSNKYRDYSEEDLENLKKILILRKLGCSVEEISAMQNHELPLNSALDASITRMEGELEQLQSALLLAKKLSKENTSCHSMEQDRLWEEITAEERRGQKFVEICLDYLEFELELLDVFPSFRFLREKFCFPIALGIGLLLCAIRGISGMLIWKENFWSSFFYPIEIFLIVSAILLPVYFFLKRPPKTVYVRSLLLSILSIAIFVASVLLSNRIFQSTAALWLGIILMLIALATHFAGRRYKKCYLLSLCLNSVANGLAVSAYYLYTQIPLSSQSFLIGLSPAVLLLLLCYFCFGILQKGKALCCLFLLLSSLLLTVGSCILWVKTGSIYGSSGFFSSLFSMIYILCYIYLIYGKNPSAPKTFSAGSFGIFSIIGAIIAIIITDGDAMDMVIVCVEDLLSELFSRHKIGK